MKQKNLTISAIIIVIAIVAVAVIAAFQTKFFSEASGPKKQTLNVFVNTALNPASGTPGSQVVVNITKAEKYPIGSPVDIRLDKYNGTLLTTFLSSGGASESNVIIPENTEPGIHPIIVYGTVSKTDSEYDIYNINGYSEFNVIPGLPQPQETSTTSTSSPTSTPTETPTTPTTTTASETPAPTETPTTTGTTTSAPTTSTAYPTASSPTTTQTTAIDAIVHPLPIITAPVPDTSTPINKPTVPEPLYSIPTLITPVPTTSTPTPQVTAVPIIVTDEKTGSTVETDKDEIIANGEDQVSINITLKNENNQPITESPTVEVSGQGNTVSDVKNLGNGEYQVNLSTTSPDEKTITVKSRDLEFPQIKIAAENPNTNLEKIANSRFKIITRWYESWWFWTLMTLGIALVFVLALSYRHKLHTTEI